MWRFQPARGTEIFRPESTALAVPSVPMGVPICPAVARYGDASAGTVVTVEPFELVDRGSQQYLGAVAVHRGRAIHLILLLPQYFSVCGSNEAISLRGVEQYGGCGDMTRDQVLGRLGEHRQSPAISAVECPARRRTSALRVWRHRRNSCARQNHSGMAATTRRTRQWENYGRSYRR